MSRVTVGPDPDEFEPRERPRGRSTTVGASREKQVVLAYDFVRARLDLERPFMPVRQPGLGSPDHPDWAVERAISRLLKEGVIRGPAPVPKTKNGQYVFYRYDKHGSRRRHNPMTSVVWAEGAWRSAYWALSPSMIITRANSARNTARRHNREVPRENAFQIQQTRSNSIFHGINPSRHRAMEVPIPSRSLTARVREYLRSLPVVDWDGMAYFPVPGPAMDAVLAWRSSLPVAEAVRDPRGGPGATKDDGPVGKTCWRCGAFLQLAYWRNRRNHALKECNLALASRIMGE